MKEEPLKIAFVLTLFVTLLAGSLHAQNSRGSLRGTTQDATGARVPSATIVAHLSESNVRREATSEDRGEFRLDDLPPGNNHITVTAAGFATAEADAPITVTTCRDIPATRRLWLDET